MWYLQICQRWRIWIVRKPQNRSALSGLEPGLETTALSFFHLGQRRFAALGEKMRKRFRLLNIIDTKR